MPQITLNDTNSSDESLFNHIIENIDKVKFELTDCETDIIQFRGKLIQKNKLKDIQVLFSISLKTKEISFDVFLENGIDVYWDESEILKYLKEKEIERNNNNG